MEMNLRVEDGEFYSFEPIERPKRKFNVAKVWGSATNLNEVDPDDRWFEERETESPSIEPSSDAPSA
jgi:antitoxin VapB